MTRSNSRSHSWLGAVFSLAIVLCLATPARADTISLGALWFDQLIPSMAGDPASGDPPSVGTNAFSIWNMTGDLAMALDGLPPNPVNAISFLDASLSFTGVNDLGSPIASTFQIGTLAPGLLADGIGNPLFVLQFPDTWTFTSAVFTATLSEQNFILADGSTFEAATPDLLFTLASIPGGLLAPNPGPDPPTVVFFTLTGDIVPPTNSVPEPASVLLLGTGFGLMLWRRAGRRATRRG